ncbi:helix-turn-helix domain-containing protein [Spongiivirga sp. MCCC 1A20706]|uniref:helix-turn-helix domain-containing protein n=1 Tax=Spongiivirga sp. MCCC 1A20706 TaxID=3160963 RepID=UPI0039774FD7
MNTTLLEISIIASTIIGCFISIVLFTSSFYRSRANNYLALSLLILSILTLLLWLELEYEDSILLAFIGNLKLEALFASTLFTYFLIQIKHNFYKSRRYKLLYLPFISCVILEIPVYYFNLYGSVSELILFLFRDTLAIIFNTVLIFWSRKLIIKATSISKDKRRWILRLNLFMILLIMCWILTRIEAYVFQSFYTVYILTIGMSLSLWWVLYYGIFKLQIIAQKEEIHKYLLTKKAAKNQPKKKINSTTTSKIISELYLLMEEEELYKNPLLSRADLANELNTNEGYLSQIINQEINKSVIQFVNDYRIEAAKKLLKDPVFNKYSVEAIGMEAGFKSKSAFYNTFKMSLDMSPGMYRKLQITS